MNNSPDEKAGLEDAELDALLLRGTTPSSAPSESFGTSEIDTTTTQLFELRSRLESANSEIERLHGAYRLFAFIAMQLSGIYFALKLVDSQNTYFWPAVFGVSIVAWWVASALSSPRKWPY